MIKQLSLIGFMMLFVASVFAQQPVSINYKREHGLPSNDVYHVIHDSKGYMWFATDNGVSRFDGREFKNYSTNDGLIDNTILELYEDYKGRIWFIPFSCRLSYIENDTIKEYQYNHVIADYLNRGHEVVKQDFFVNSNDVLFFNTYGDGLIVIDDNGKSEVLYSEYMAYHYTTFIERVEQDTVDMWHVYYNDGNFLVSRDSSLNVDRNRKWTMSYSGRKHYFEYSDNRRLLSKSHMAFMMTDTTIKWLIDFEDEIIWMSKISENDLWVCVENSGVHHYPNIIDSRDSIVHYFEDETITSITRDSESGIWFSSLKHGVFYLPNLALKTFNPNTNQSNTTFKCIDIVSEDELWIGGTNGYYFSIIDGITRSHFLAFDEYFNEAEKSLNINSIYHDEIYNRLLGTTNGVFKDTVDIRTQTSPPLEYLDKARLSIMDFSRMQNNSLIAPVTFGYLIISPDFKTEVNSRFEDVVSDRRTDVACEQSDGSLLLGCINGLYELKNDSLRIAYEGEFFTNRITDLYYSSAYTVVASKGKGLAWILPDTILYINESNGLPSNIVTNILYHDEKIYAGTMKGMGVVSLNVEQKSFAIKSYSKSNGLAVDQINDLAVYENQLYVVSDNAILEWDIPSSEEPTSSIPLYLMHIIVNSNDTMCNNALSLNHLQNALEFHFSSISFQNADKLHYKYRLQGFSEKWHTTDNDFLRFTHLPPAAYNLQLIAYDDNGNESEEAIECTFTIHPPFWRTWWFIAMCLIILVGAISLIFLAIQKRKLRELNRINVLKQQEQEKRNGLEKELNKTRQLAFNKQMNPHFIYNSLNSIQNFILKNDRVNSSNYLSKFSDLMRKILDHSNQEFVTIEDDLNALKVYLELEQMRFDNKFDYDIVLEPEAISELLIVPLLIQPFVENAIWHGLMPLKRKGSLKISLIKLEELIEITIEDNGVGRRFHAKGNKSTLKKHVPIGISVSEKRIELLKSLYNINIQLRFVDIFMEDQAAGTRVLLQIPIINSNEI